MDFIFINENFKILDNLKVTSDFELKGGILFLGRNKLLSLIKFVRDNYITTI